MKLRVLAAAAVLSWVSAAPVEAAWPERPIRVIVPFAPGGTTDILARSLQRVIQEQNLLPQPLAVINVTGHFSVGARQVKTAPADGYTVLALHIALLSGEIVDPRRGISWRDFDPVALTGGVCLHPVVRNDSPFRTLRDVVNAASAQPGTVVFGVNIGAINHMAGLFIERHSQARFRYVQIGGGAENFAALTGGHTQFAVLSSSEYQTYKANGIRALGYTGPQRLQLEPDIATMREQGLDFEFCVENYWFAPQGTPREAIDGLATAFERALRTPFMDDFFRRQASTNQFMRGEAYRQRIEQTFNMIEPIARAAAPPQPAQPAAPPAQPAQR
jgi:putative tricarboxylic transport membrane protein